MNVATELIATPDRHLARRAIAPFALLLLALSTVLWAQPTPEDSLPSVEELRHRLKLDVLEDRIANVRALARPRDKKAVAPLMAVLRNDSFLRVRWEAAKSLGAVGKPAVCSLIPILQTGKPDWSVDPALYALELIADPASAEAVLSVFLNSGRLRQVNAALALEQMPEAAVPLLTAGLTEGAWGSRVRCAHMLIDLRSTASGPAIVQLIQWLITARDRVTKPPPKPEPKGGPTMEMKVGPAGSELRVLPRDTLGDMAGAATKLLIGLAVIDTASFDRIAAGDTADRFAWAMASAGWNDDSDGAAARRYFGVRLYATDWRISSQATCWLGHYKDTSRIALAYRGLKSTSPDSIASALELVEILRGSQAVDEVLPFLKDDGRVGRHAIEALARTGGATAHRALVARFAGATISTRVNIIRALGSPSLTGFRDSSSIEVIRSAFRDAPLALSRVALDQLLNPGVLSDARANGYRPEALVLEAWADRRPELRQVTLDLIRTLAAERVVTLSERQMTDSLRCAVVRMRRDSSMAALLALGYLGDTWAVPRLVELMQAGGQTGHDASLALLSIGGTKMTLELERLLKAGPREWTDLRVRFGLRNDTLAHKLAYINGWRDIGGKDGLSIDEVRSFGPVAAGRVLRTTGWLNDTTPTPQVEILEYFGRRVVDTLRAYLRSQQAKGDTEPYAFGVAAALLACFGDSEGKRVVSGILGSSSRWSYSKSGAAHVLARTRDRWAVEQLVANRLDTLGKPKSQIYSALGLCPVRAARTAAEADLVSPVPETRLAATQVLAKIGDAASFRRMAVIILDSVPRWAQPDITDKPGVVASDFRFYERIRRSEMLKAMADIEPDSITRYLLLETGSEAIRRAFVPRALYEIVLKHHPSGLVPRLIELSNPDSPEAGGTFTTVEYAVLSLSAIEGDFVTEYLALRTKARKGAQDVAANWDRLLRKQDPDLDFQLWEAMQYSFQDKREACISYGSPWLRDRAERAARHPTALYRY